MQDVAKMDVLITYRITRLSNFPLNAFSGFTVLITYRIARLSNEIDAPTLENLVLITYRITRLSNSGRTVRILSSFNYLQNNKTLKLILVCNNAIHSFNYLQNNKTLKRVV